MGVERDESPEGIFPTIETRQQRTEGKFGRN